jgi:NADH:ubiquinone oxidoreductase subunit 5 (subunit L)/multisubunit Na+/H+ antiporter MnhA subunit
MNILTNVFGRRARQQRESFLEQKRERFLNVHKSDTPPSELLAPPPRQLRWTSAFLWICVLFLLFFGIRLFEQTVVGAFRRIDAREIETRGWVQKQTARPPSNEREANRQKLVNEVGSLETETAHQLRWTMLCVAIIFALPTIVFPVALFWLLLRIHHLLRNGTVTRAELVSHKRSSSSGRVSFIATDGRQVEVIRTVPTYAPSGLKLWVLYSSWNPKHALVYSSELAKLLPK